MEHPSNPGLYSYRKNPSVWTHVDTLFGEKYVLTRPYVFSTETRPRGERPVLHQQPRQKESATAIRKHASEHLRNPARILALWIYFGTSKVPRKVTPQHY